MTTFSESYPGKLVVVCPSHLLNDFWAQKLQRLLSVHPQVTAVHPPTLSGATPSQDMRVTFHPLGHFVVSRLQDYGLMSPPSTQTIYFYFKPGLTWQDFGCIFCRFHFKTLKRCWREKKAIGLEKESFHSFQQFPLQESLLQCTSSSSTYVMSLLPIF